METTTLNFGVAAVAQCTVATVFASAEVNHPILFGREADGRKVRSLVGTVAERLVFTLAAGTPEIGFSGFDGDWIRGTLADGGFSHIDAKVFSLPSRGCR